MNRRMRQRLLGIREPGNVLDSWGKALNVLLNARRVLNSKRRQE
jgi:hypothetical protein